MTTVLIDDIGLLVTHDHERPEVREAALLVEDGVVAWWGEAASAPSAPQSRPATVIAPALTIGLYGRRVSGLNSIALNGSPLGSTPTWANPVCRPACSTAMQ